MFIKYGEEKYLEAFLNKGEMYFNPCGVFRTLESKQCKGIGDANDGGININISATSNIINPMIPRKYKFSVICDGCQNIPIYCLKRAQNEYISQEECDKLNKDFPKHTHALIINEEEDFLENIRYSLKNKAFAHEVFYSDKFTTDYIQFLLNGDSDIMFYKSRVKRPLLYYDMEVKLFENVNTTTIRIDESNAYKTMFHKGEFFRYQNEYRIVLPYERITNGKIYKVEPFNAKLVKIKDMVKHY